MIPFSVYVLTTPPVIVSPTPVNPDPSPTKEVAVRTPVTFTPEVLPCALVVPSPSFSTVASIPERLLPSPLNEVAVITPVDTTL